METKKTSKSDLEKRRGLFLEIGFIVSIVACLVAFNIRSYNKTQKELMARTDQFLIDDAVLPTSSVETPPPPPKDVEMVVTDLTVVDNDAEDDFAMPFDAGDNENRPQAVFEVTLPEEEVVEETAIFTVVEENPDFPGGLGALAQFLADNIHYPQLAKDNNIEGKVYVSFVVEKDGRVDNIKILKDIGGGCGAEAVRVVKSMPRWKPGKERGKAVRTEFSLPVNFTLQ